MNKKRLWGFMISFYLFLLLFNAVADDVSTQTSTPTNTPSQILSSMNALSFANQMLGDANNDSIIDIIDALVIAQYSVDIIPAVFNSDNANVDLDNMVTIIDALLISQYTVGLITKFPRQDAITPSPTPTVSPVSIPSVPTGLTIGTITSLSIDLSWAVSAGAAGYNIYRSSSSSGTYMKTASSATTSFTDGGLNASTTYYYKVSAFNNTGESTQSGSINGTTLSTPTPSSGKLDFQVTTVTYGGNYAPRNVGAIWIETSSGSFVKTLKLWANAQKSRLSIWNSSSGGNVVDAVTSATISSHQTHSVSWNLKNTSGAVVADGNYTVRVEYTENNNAGQSISYPFTVGPTSSTTTPANTNYFKSVSVKFTAGSSIPIPSVPSGLTAGSVTSSSITVSWTAVSNTNIYTIYRSTSSTGTYAKAGYTTKTTYTDGNLTAATTYYYKISARNSSGESAQSAAISATTQSLIQPPPVPSGLAVGMKSATIITLSWSSSAGANIYNLYRDTSSGGSFTQLAGTTASTSFIDKGLMANTTYYYKVSATNTAGESAKSLTVSDKTNVLPPLSSPFPAAKKSFYVSVTGNDSYSGTYSAPWRTIQKAVNTVTSGSTIFVMAGTYNEKITFNSSGTVTDYITVTSYNKDKVIVNGVGSSGSAIFNLGKSKFIRIAYLTITNTSASSADYGIYINGGSNILIENNTVYGVGTGIAITSESNMDTAQGNVVIGNVIYNNNQSGIVIGSINYSSGGKTVNNHIINNTFFKNASSNPNQGELNLQSAEFNTIKNNIFYSDNLSNLITAGVQTDTYNTLDYNLWFTDAGSAGARFSWGGTVYTGYQNFLTASSTNKNSLFVNPNFVSTTGTPDLHLNIDSPAVDAGDPAFAVLGADRDFIIRVVGISPDIGAYEFY